MRLPRWLFGSLGVSWVLLFASFVEASLPVGGNTQKAVRAERRSADYGTFVDVAAGRQLPVEETPTWGSAWADITNDGKPELLIGRHKRSPWLLTPGDGAPGLLEIGDLTLLEEDRTYYDRHTCAWGEADGDGRVDLYCVSGAQKGVGTGPNRMLVAASGFADEAPDRGVADPLGRGRTLNWLDFDSDGDLDLFVGNEVRSDYPNLLYRNTGGSFEPVDSPVARTFATMDSSWGDVDRDGDPDLLLLGHGELGALFFANEGGSFVEQPIEGITGEQWMSGAWGDFDGDGWIDLHLVGADSAVVMRNHRGSLHPLDEVRLDAGRASVWFDYDNDGDLDLYIVQGAPRGGSLADGDVEDLLLVRESGRFVQVGPIPGNDVGSGDSVSAADFDRDGRMDLFVTNGYLDKRGPVSLLRNVSDAGTWAALRLQGDAANPVAFGARLRVLTSQGSYWRYLTDGVSFHAQSEIGYVHLGLGVARSARVRMVWPDGSVDCYSVKAGSVSDAIKGTSPC